MASRRDKLFNSRKAKKKKSLTRKRAKFQPRRRVLIVCEGEKTEVIYLNALVVSLGLTTANVEVCGDCDSAPKSVVDFGLEKYKTDNDYDLIFFVFDRDSHPSYDEALRSISGLSKSKKFNSSHLKAITSFPCFEIWFLLHFEAHSRPYVAGGGKSPCGNLISALKKKEGFEHYEKGHSGHFEELHNRLHQAKLNSARTLQQSIENGSAEHHGNPSTLMHTLVEALQDIAEKHHS